MRHASDGVGCEDNPRALLATRAVSNVGRIPVSRVPPIIMTGTSSWTVLAFLCLPILLAYLQVSYCSFAEPEPFWHRRKGQRPFRCKTACPGETVVGNYTPIALSGHPFVAMEKQYGNISPKTCIYHIGVICCHWNSL